MLRITQREEGDQVIVQLEGRVAGPWVAEFRRTLESLSSRLSCVALDLAGVGYVDASGEQLLREALAGGVHIRSRSGFVGTLLDLGDPGGRQ
jgi:anti-anti-sigma regulatory factor